MFDKYLEIETSSIVFLGVFNPVIFQPMWLANKDLVQDVEAENASVEVIHPDIVKFKLGDWLDVEVMRNRCQFKTSKEPYFPMLRDLALNIFRILKETPIDSVGLNHIYDISLPSENKYYEFGNKLVPLDAWSEDIKEPRLLTLEIIENSRFDKKTGSRRIRITPSDKKINHGVTININDHFIFSKNDENKSIYDLLENYWDESRVNSKELAANILKKNLES